MKKTAIITGAGGYIGGETAKTLAKEGIAVAVCDINREAVEKTVSAIKAAGGDAEGYIIDVADSASVDKTVSEVVKRFGGLDISIHVAGGSARIAGGNYVPLIEQTDHVIDTVLKVNLYGAMYVSRAAAKEMIKGGRGGRIINFSSIVGTQGLTNCTEYAAAKGGVIALTKSLAKELGEYKITVNSVAPGVVMRPEENDPDRAFKTNFLGEKCTAADIADLVAFLVSDKARFITGQVCVCDGGRSLAMKGSE